MWGSYSGVQGVLHCLTSEKESLFDAAILIFSPLAGLRPSRSGEALTLNFPNPANETSSLLTTALTMLFNKLSRIAWACALICRELPRRL
jgi:hypothetical protein